MIVKFRVILDAEQDVFRDIEISSNAVLLDFHQSIKEAFSLEGEELASFFLSNDAWFQGSEIPMEDMSGEDDNAEIMSNTQIGSVVSRPGARMIYLYDFLSMWTFFCEVVEVKPKEEIEKPRVTFSYGETPKEAPVNESMQISIEEDLDDWEEEEDNDPYSFY